MYSNIYSILTPPHFHVTLTEIRGSDGGKESTTRSIGPFNLGISIGLTETEIIFWRDRENIDSLVYIVHYQAI